MWNLMIVVLLSYIVGSIPTSIIATKLARSGDIRKFGSGNAGGTNVLRMLGWKIGVAVIIFDLLKGAAAAYYIPRIFWEPGLPFQNQTPFADFTIVQIICGVAAIFVTSDGKTLKVANPDKIGDKVAEKVTVKGSVDGETLTIESVS